MVKSLEDVTLDNPQRSILIGCVLNDYRLRALGPSGWGNPQSFKTAETGGSPQG